MKTDRLGSTFAALTDARRDDPLRPNLGSPRRPASARRLPTSPVTPPTRQGRRSTRTAVSPCGVYAGTGENTETPANGHAVAQYDVCSQN